MIRSQDDDNPRDNGCVIETGHTILTGPGCELLRNEQVKAAYLGM